MSLLAFQRPDKIITSKTNSFEGLFEFKPLEPGYGVTIGNALRRVLLSGLEGYAITGIRVEGVEHEFAIIKGVKEDLTEIILNLKQVRLKATAANTSRFEKIKLKVSGKTEVKASFIEESTNLFEVVNKDMVILHLQPEVQLNIELTIAKNRGYITSEENKLSNIPAGYIAIDSIHTPIKNVQYAIENTRVEQRTDYEKLTIHVITDGTIDIEFAIKQASAILEQHLRVISDGYIIENVKDEDKQEIVVDEQTLKLRQVLKTSLEDLDLSVRAFNCLKAAKITSLIELVKYSEEELMKFRNFGQKSLDEINQMLKERGLSFGMNLSKISKEL